MVDGEPCGHGRMQYVDDALVDRLETSYTSCAHPRRERAALARGESVVILITRLYSLHVVEDTYDRSCY
jgi:hypothetical protein